MSSERFDGGTPMYDALSFVYWLERVDEAVYGIAGVSRHDLADYCYRDAYDSGMEPADVAREMLAEAGFPSEEESDEF